MNGKTATMPCGVSVSALACMTASLTSSTSGVRARTRSSRACARGSFAICAVYRTNAGTRFALIASSMRRTPSATNWRVAYRSLRRASARTSLTLGLVRLVITGAFLKYEWLIRRGDV